MQLYRMRIESDGTGRFREYLDNHYIGLGDPGLGDLERIEETEFLAKLAQAGCLKEGETEPSFTDYWRFARGMHDGDFVMLQEGDRLMLGDLGDYYYVPEEDGAEDACPHRRGVTWLRALRREALHPELQAFLAQEGAIGRFDRSLDAERLDALLDKPATNAAALVDEATIREAIEVLKVAMRSDDPERRERAAIAILQAARSQEAPDRRFPVR